MCEITGGARPIARPPRPSMAGCRHISDVPRQHRQPPSAKLAGRSRCKTGPLASPGVGDVNLTFVNELDSFPPRRCTAESVCDGEWVCWTGRRYSWTNLPNMNRGATTSCRGGRGMSLLCRLQLPTRRWRDWRARLLSGRLRACPAAKVSPISGESGRSGITRPLPYRLEPHRGSEMRQGSRLPSLARFPRRPTPSNAHRFRSR